MHSRCQIFGFVQQNNNYDPFSGSMLIHWSCTVLCVPMATIMLHTLCAVTSMKISWPTVFSVNVSFSNTNRIFTTFWNSIYLFHKDMVPGLPLTYIVSLTTALWAQFHGSSSRTINRELLIVQNIVRIGSHWSNIVFEKEVISHSYIKRHQAWSHQVIKTYLVTSYRESLIV